MALCRTTAALLGSFSRSLQLCIQPLSYVLDISTQRNGSVLRDGAQCLDVGARCLLLGDPLRRRRVETWVNA